MITKVFDKLYQGNLEDVEQVSNCNDVDVVVYLGQGLPKKTILECNVPIIHIPLNDGFNSEIMIDLALLNISYIELDDKVLVACRKGVSRSIAMCAAYLYVYRKEDFPQSFDECLSCVQMITKSEGKPNKDLIASMKSAISKYWG